MPDREKVIKGLECHSKGSKGCLFDCPYGNENGCQLLLCSDAIAILKEHEAVKPVLIREGRNKNYNDYVCPRCDNEVVYEQNYCSECGVRFLWEGR